MIYELLEEGEEKAVTAKVLAQYLHCSRRIVSQLVEKERRKGFAICATCDSKNPGYYKPRDRYEMQSYCGDLKRRIGEISKTRRACLKTIDNLPG